MQEQKQDNTPIKIILFMQSAHTQENQSSFDYTPRKQSSSPLTDHSDCNSPIVRQANLYLPHDLRLNLFEKTVDQFSISQKMNMRGINWLLALGWSKGYGQPCIWSAILLFYAYKNNVPLQKQELQPLMAVCLQLSSKFYETHPLESRELLLVLSRPVSRERIATYEQKLLQLIQFNLIIPHYLTSIWEAIDDNQTVSKICFICDLLTLNNHQIFFDKAKIEKIASLITGSGEESYYDRLEIIQTLQEKESRTLYNRYSNKFDVDSFLNEFNFSY